MNGNTTNGAVAKLPRSRLLPHVVSELAESQPQKIWAALPIVCADASKGYQDISFARLNYAISRATIWLLQAFDVTDPNSFDALAYMGPPDSRYVIFAIAAIKAGFQMLFLSPRNSDEAQYAVLEQANCQIFLCASSMKKRVEVLIDRRPEFSAMVQKTVPEQEELLKDEFVPNFPYQKSLEQARREPLVMIHTSSTTGMPKIVRLNQGYGLHEDVVQHIPKHNGLDIITRKPFYGQCRMFVAMPLFHAGGILLTLLKSIYHDIVSVFQPNVPLNAEVFDAILRYGKCTGCVIPPSLLEDMIAVPSYFDTLASLDFVQFGSGPLSKITGDTLLTRQSECPHYIGSSECGLYILLELEDPVRDWQYFRFHPWSGVDMRLAGGEEDVRELFVVRGDNKIPGIQPVFELFPDLEEWPTRELYKRHPTVPDQWRFIGRNDDVMVLTNGEKINPIETESRIANTHPAISGALVIGSGKFMPGLLLETRGIDARDPKERFKLIQAIWPTVELANLEAPKHGQLVKSLILFTSPGKPFARTPKLSVRRGPTIESYATEIDEMYHRFETDLEDAAEIEFPANVILISLEDIKQNVERLIQKLTGWDGQLNPHDDIFALGLDSLHVARIVRALKQLFNRAGLSEVQESIIPQVVYNNPTVNALSQSLHGLIFTEYDGLGLSNDISREQQIESLITEHTKFDFDQRIRNKKRRQSQPSVLRIILTGSTGSLGSHLLLTLLNNPLVADIYCLNRAKDARDRQTALLDSQGLQSSTRANFDTRVHFLHTDSLAAPLLGLADEDTYAQLKSAAITHIIHNAWPVNFNLSLASFSSNVAGVRSLIEFCASVSGQPPRLLFVSSLSSVTSLSMRSCVPEEIIYDDSAPSKMGYGESKYVAERILHEATVQSGGRISTAVLRVGQIAGPVGHSTAVWPTREWLPSLVISSKSIGALPETLGRMEMVDWVPVDVLADVIGGLIVGDSDGDYGVNEYESSTFENEVYHLLNPNSVSWHDDLLPTLKAQIGVDVILPLEQWVERVSFGPHAADKAEPNPAQKILDFYKALVVSADGGHKESRDGGKEEVLAPGRYETKKTAQHSKTFREMGPVTKEWIEKWADKWFQR